MGENRIEQHASAAHFVLLPTAVLYDKDLPPRAKLLYADISALTKAKGYCYASNEYFAQRHDIKKDTVSRLIAQLVKAGYLHMVVLRDEQNAVQERRMYLSERYVDPIGKKGDSSWKKISEPPGEKADKNHTREYITPLTPQREAPEDAETLFEAFWQAYPKKTAKQNARKSFCRLKADRTLLDTMLADIARRLEHDEQWRREGGRYIPYPATWLNGRRWEDELPDACGSDGLPTAVDSIWEEDGCPIW